MYEDTKLKGVPKWSYFILIQKTLGEIRSNFSLLGLSSLQLQSIQSWKYVYIHTEKCPPVNWCWHVWLKHWHILAHLNLKFNKKLILSSTECYSSWNIISSCLTCMGRKLSSKRQLFCVYIFMLCLMKTCLRNIP